MKRSILFAGSMVVDRVKLVDYYPKEGNLTVIRDVVRATGGMAINNPINLKVLDPSLDIGAVGRIGDDADGELILSDLKQRKIDCSGIVVDRKAHTSFTDVITVRDTGARTFFHSYGACARFGWEDFDFAAIAAKYSYAQVGYHLLLDKLDETDDEYGTVLGRVLHQLRQLGVTTSIDLVSEEGPRFRSVVTKTLPYVDDLIVNEVEAGGIVGLELRDPAGQLDPELCRQAVAQLFSLGVKRTVVIHAPEGAVGAKRGAEPVCVGSYAVGPEEIKGTTGAGDAFCSGVIYGLYHDWPFVDAMRLGNAMGAMNLFHPSCTGGAQPLSKVREFMAQRSVRPM